MAMPEIGPTIPYAWVKYAKNAVSAAVIALNEATKRMENLNPLENMEEMAYLRKTRDTFQKAIPMMEFVEKIDP